MLSSKKSNDILQKRIPKNPKYENIESTLDTGSSLSRYLKRIEDIRQNYRIRKDELFKRMKVTTFVQLVLQVAEINNHLYNNKEDNLHFHDNASVNENNNHYMDEAQSEIGTARTTDTIVSHRSTFQGVIRGVGELDVNNTNSHATESALHSTNSNNKVVFDSMPYLLLDVRDRDEYDQCHLIKSLSYPSAMISRSVNFETKEMLACRNRPGKIIIVYDEEERIAPRVADTLVQRGYDNLFMLSGGLRVAYKKFPQGLITGRIPESIRQITLAGRAKSKQRLPKLGELPNTSQSKRSITQSNASTTSELIEMKSDFTIDDLAHLSMNLDTALDSNSSVGSSIYSHQTKSNTTRSSVISSLTASTGQVDHKKPFKC